jgi:hypothetical protein
LSILYGENFDLERDQPIFGGWIEVAGRLSLFADGVIFVWKVATIRATKKGYPHRW